MNPPSSPREVATGAEEAHWFAEEVQPHESALRAYLKGSFPAVRDVDDVVQESYLRLLKARTAHPIQSGRAFLFTIARRFAIDLLRKAKRTSAHEVVLDDRAMDVSEDKADAAEALSVQQEVALLAEAMHTLPSRCREIMILRKFERLSHQEIAQRLGISVATVEVQIFRGMDKCTRYLRRRGVVIAPRAKP